MTADVTEKIATRRQEMGLPDTEVARRCGLSIDEYFDIELHPDEVFTITPLSRVKELCRVLKFDFCELFEIPCSFCEQEAFAEENRLPRNELIRKKRQSKGLSANELGDRIDFMEPEIHELESDSERLESWPLRLIRKLASELDIPIQLLLAVKCRTCGR